MRNDEVVQAAARNILQGCAPERKNELEMFWDTYQPRFSLVEDAGQDGLFVLQGGLYRDVWFNHRAMRVFWLGSFIAWEGYRAISESKSDENIDLDRFSQMVGMLEETLGHTGLDDAPYPQGIPEPGMYPDGTREPQTRATAELATFAAGWAFLHEIRHLQHQQDGTGAGPDGSRELRHDEEFSCDAFATDFLLSGIDEYAASQCVDSALVRQKRELGIYFALFVMTLIVRGNWGESESHPAMQARMERVATSIKASRGSGGRVSDVLALGAFAALWTLYPNAPSPVMGLSQNASPTIRDLGDAAGEADHEEGA